LRRIGTIRGASWKDVEVKHERFDTTDRNAAIFMAPAVARRYGNPALFAAEAMILLRYRDAFTGKRVLDLAVGSGRTTRYLAALPRIISASICPGDAGFGASPLSAGALPRHGHARDRQASTGELRFHLPAVEHPPCVFA
jgi:hypothetical protein